MRDTFPERIRVRARSVDRRLRYLAPYDEMFRAQLHKEAEVIKTTMLTFAQTASEIGKRTEHS